MQTDQVIRADRVRLSKGQRHKLTDLMMGKGLGVLAMVEQAGSRSVVFVPYDDKGAWQHPLSRIRYVGDGHELVD